MSCVGSHVPYNGGGTNSARYCSIMSVGRIGVKERPSKVLRPKMDGVDAHQCRLSSSFRRTSPRGQHGVVATPPPQPTTAFDASIVNATTSSGTRTCVRAASAGSSEQRRSIDETLTTTPIELLEVGTDEAIVTEVVKMSMVEDVRPHPLGHRRQPRSCLIRVPTEASHEVGRHLEHGSFRLLDSTTNSNNSVETENESEEVKVSATPRHSRRLPSVGGLEGPPLVDNIPSFSSSSDEDENDVDDDDDERVRERGGACVREMSEALPTVVAPHAGPSILVSSSNTRRCTNVDVPTNTCNLGVNADDGLHVSSIALTEPSSPEQGTPDVVPLMENNTTRHSDKFMAMRQMKKSWGALFFSPKAQDGEDEKDDGDDDDH